MYLVSRNSSIPSRPPSRPSPECLTPPNGAARLDTIPWLIATIGTIEEGLGRLAAAAQDLRLGAATGEVLSFRRVQS